LGHDLLKLYLVHLAVGDRNARLGHHLPQLPSYIGDALHSIVNKEDLAVSLQLSQDRFAHQAVVILSRVGLMGSRSSGGVSIVLMSRIPARAMCKVRGMGVALRLRTSTSCRSFLKCSF